MLSRIFDDAGCAGSIRAERADGSASLGTDPDELVVAASVIKVLIAVEGERQFAGGALDPSARVRLRAQQRTPGPVGFSLYDDDIEVSARDLVVAMLTVSDNVATDALLDLVGIEACNTTAAELGLTNTRVVSSIGVAIDSIAQAAGFGSWRELMATSAQPSGEAAETERVVRMASALNPAAATATTPGDMCRLLRAIWSDSAADPSGCDRIRRLMASQLTRDRLASAFPPPAHVAAKSGGLIGVFRHEIGTITLPDDRRYFAAVFTRKTKGDASPAAINSAIGRAAAAAVELLEQRT